MIKLSSLEKFLFSSSANQNGWAKSLYLLGSSLGTIEGVQVAGVAPDFGDWYVCFYVDLAAESRVLNEVRQALQKVGAERKNVSVVSKAREFGRKNGHRRAILRIEPARAEFLACHLQQNGSERSMKPAKIAI